MYWWWRRCPASAWKTCEIAVEDDLLTITAAHGDKQYRKEVLLPASLLREKMQVTCNNGVVEIKCMR